MSGSTVVLPAADTLREVRAFGGMPH